MVALLSNMALLYGLKPEAPHLPEVHSTLRQWQDTPIKRLSGPPPSFVIYSPTVFSLNSESRNGDIIAKLFS